MMPLGETLDFTSESFAQFHLNKINEEFKDAEDLDHFKLLVKKSDKWRELIGLKQKSEEEDSQDTMHDIKWKGSYWQGDEEEQMHFDHMMMDEEGQIEGYGHDDVGTAPGQQTPADQTVI